MARPAIYPDRRTPRTSRNRRSKTVVGNRNRFFDFRSLDPHLSSQGPRLCRSLAKRTHLASSSTSASSKGNDWLVQILNSGPLGGVNRGPSELSSSHQWNSQVAPARWV